MERYPNTACLAKHSTLECYTKQAGNVHRDLLSDARCINGSMMDDACYRHDVLNPSLLGAFEPMAGCDTELVNSQRVVSALCEDCVRTPVNEYLKLEEDSAEMTCSQMSVSSSGVTVDYRAEINLCSNYPRHDSRCTNKQGVLGKELY